MGLTTGCFLISSQHINLRYRPNSNLLSILKIVLAKTDLVDI